MTTAREYRRLSKADEGSSLERQGVDNYRGAIEQGWILGEPYIDDGRSASRFARKDRDDFARLVADLSSGAFDAEIVILWESSRGSRRVGEWVHFIELCEEKRVRIYVTTHERLYDPANGRDRKTLIEDAVDSEFESYKTHRRNLGTAALEAGKGRPHGIAPHGLMPVYDEKTGKLTNWVENEAESTVPKELFRLLEAGHSLTAIEREFREAGHLNRSGQPFTRQHLRTMATKHAYVGKRFYNGQEFEGTWDALVSAERFYKVQAIISAPSRKTSRNGRAKYELTDTLRCGECGGPMMVNTARQGYPVYKCRNRGCTAITKAGVDEVVVGALLGYLARPDLYDLLAAPGGDDGKVRAVRGDLAQARANKAEMESATPENLHDARVLSRSVAALATKITDLEAQERELTMPAVLASIVEPGTDVRVWWSDAPISARREVARIILSPQYLGEVRVRREPVPGQHVDAIERLEWARS